MCCSVQAWNVNLTSIAQESAWIHACKGSALNPTGAPSLGINGEKIIGTQADPWFHTEKEPDPQGNKAGFVQGSEFSVYLKRISSKEGG